MVLGFFFFFYNFVLIIVILGHRKQMGHLSWSSTGWLSWRVILCFFFYIPEFIWTVVVCRPLLIFRVSCNLAFLLFFWEVFGIFSSFLFFFFFRSRPLWFNAGCELCVWELGIASLNVLRLLVLFLFFNIYALLFCCLVHWCVNLDSHGPVSTLFIYVWFILNLIL